MAGLSGTLAEEALRRDIRVPTKHNDEQKIDTKERRDEDKVPLFI